MAAERFAEGAHYRDGLPCRSLYRVRGGEPAFFPGDRVMIGADGLVGGGRGYGPAQKFAGMFVAEWNDAEAWADLRETIDAGEVMKIAKGEI